MSSDLNLLASINEELADRLENDPSFRRDYIRLWAQSEVAAEIRQLRKKRKKRQSELAALIGTGQSAISRIEKADYDGWTYKTLIAVAERLDARLRIVLEPIEAVIKSYRPSNTSEESGSAVITGKSTADDADMSEAESTFGAKLIDDGARPTSDGVVLQ